MIRAAILVSGDCRLTRRLLDSAFFNEIENLRIAGVISSNPEAQALTRARNLRIPTFVVDEHLFPHALSYGQALLNKLKQLAAETGGELVAGRANVVCEMSFDWKKLFEK